MRRAVFVVPVAIAAFAACSSFTSSDVPSDGGATTDAGDDAAPDAPPANDGGADAPDGHVPACPDGRGPKMLRIDRPSGAGAFCIDTTEVTQAQYAAFLNAMPSPDVGAQRADCQGKNVNFVPTCPQTAGSSLPADCIEFCDALAYCTWAGKRLCGYFGIKGTAVTPTPDDSVSEWFAACSRFGTRAYPYGPAPDAGACNSSSSGPAPVGSFPGCEGGFPGLFDMSNNVAEWEDQCTSADDGAFCEVRGGSFGDGPMPCAGNFGVKKLADPAPDGHYGFRCCADLQ